MHQIWTSFFEGIKDKLELDDWTFFPGLELTETEEGITEQRLLSLVKLFTHSYRQKLPTEKVCDCGVAVFRDGLFGILFLGNIVWGCNFLRLPFLRFFYQDRYLRILFWVLIFGDKKFGDAFLGMVFLGLHFWGWYIRGPFFQNGGFGTRFFRIFFSRWIFEDVTYRIIVLGFILKDGTFGDGNFRMVHLGTGFYRMVLLGTEKHRSQPGESSRGLHDGGLFFLNPVPKSTIL